MPDEAGSGGPPATLEVGGEVEPTAGGPGVLEPLGEPARVEEKVLTTKQLAWRRFKRHKLAIGSAIILILITLMVILVDAISKYNFHELGNVLDSLKGPSGKHWFGTDNLGRDEFVRVMYGGRISLLVGVAVAASAGTVGAVVGGLAGFYGGWHDNVLMRVTDLFLSIPFLVVLIIASKLLGGSVFDVVILLAAIFWMPDARIVRGVFLSLKEKEYVEAARSSGASNKRIIFYHIMPNALGPIIVNVTLLVAAAILTESALSFLGFGIAPPTPTWGNLLSDSQPFMLLAPWLVWFPEIMILITVLCVNFVGDGLRDALDPHQRLGGHE